MANNDCEAEAIAPILRRPHDETAAITSDATIAGQANLKMPLALALALLALAARSTAPAGTGRRS